MNDQSEMLGQLASRLKEARAAKGLSLEAVAKLSGVSRSMVSQIERGESSPTVATLWNLTRALQVDFAGLLDGGDGRGGIEVLRAGETPTIDYHGDGCRIRILSPPEDAGSYEVYDLSFETGGQLDSQPHATGAHEALTVISGTLSVTAGGKEATLGPGDTARYAADCAHNIKAETGPARAFLIVRNG